MYIKIRQYKIKNDRYNLIEKIVDKTNLNYFNI